MKIQSILLFLILSGNLYIGNAQTPKVFNKEESAVYVPIITNKWGDFGVAKDYALGEKISGAVSDRVFFAVNLTAGVYNALLNFDPLRTGSVELNFHVYSRSDYGSVIAKSNLGIAPKELLFIAPENGRYYILISLYKPVEQGVSANFDFTLNKSNQYFDNFEPNNTVAQAYPIRINEIKASVDGVDDPRDYYQIQFRPSRQYKITLSWLGNSDLDLHIYDDAQMLIARSVRAGVEPEMVTFIPRKDTIHYVLVSTFASNGTQNYELLVIEQ